MNIGFYSPYLDTLGGGERYILTLASHWKKMHTVTLFWDDPTICSKGSERFGLDLHGVCVLPNIFRNASLIKKMLVSASYDLMVFLSDGSVPMSLAKRNILHFQMPFSSVSMHEWKRHRYQFVVCNSEFTKNNLDPSIRVPTVVIYPPVSIDDFTSRKKENIIVSTGRFSKSVNVKRQDVMIRIFRDMTKTKRLEGWKLVLMGGALYEDRAYVAALKKETKGDHIEILENISFEGMQNIYKKARIYWHATGFGQKNLQRMEHFGISTVEAMAAGCIPVVYKAGGQTEVVTDGITGYTWRTIGECIDKTLLALSTHTVTKERVRRRAKDFSKERFTTSWDILLSKI